MMDEFEFMVEKYQFADEAEAELARSEVKKIAYIEERMNYDNLKMVYNFYNNCIENRVFVTPIGYAYMEKTRDFIASKKYKEEILPIPVASNNHIAKREVKRDKKQIKQLEEVVEKLNVRFRTSILFAIVLLLMVIGMFLITLTSDNPNIINYENALINRYASWEEELTDREEVVREKELELSISNEE